MANHEINEEQEAVNKALRMIETSDPVHADVYNALFSILINNDVFLEKLANKMVQQVMISHVMDSTNPDMVMGADQGPVITKLIEKVQEQVNVLNTKAKKLNRNYGNMSGETIEKSLKMVFEQSDADSIILGFFFNSGVHTVFGFKYDTQKYGYVESMSWNCQEHHYLVYSNGVYTFTSA